MELPKYLTPLGVSPRSFSQSLVEAEEMKAQAKRVTLMHLQRQRDAVMSKMVRQAMRLSKARKAGDSVGIANQTAALSRSQLALTTLEREIASKG